MRQSLPEFSNQSEFLFADAQVIASPYFKPVLRERFILTEHHPSGEAKRTVPPARKLVEESIPIESRIAHLLTDIDIVPQDRGEYQTQFTIARKLGVLTLQVVAKGNIIGIETMRGSESKGPRLKIYPEYSLELIRDELEWDALYKELPDKLSIVEMHHILKRKGQWIQRTAADLRYVPTLEKQPCTPMVRMYPKDLLLKLRHIILLYPPAGDWHLVTELENLTKRSRSWIVREFGKAGIETTERWLKLQSRVADYYPPESPELIKTLGK